MKLNTKQDGREAAKAASRAANSFNPDYADLMKIIEAPEERKILCREWIKTLAATEHFDARNEYSVKVGKALEAVAKAAIIPEAETPAWVTAFCEDMARDHRTIQQAFSGMVFRIFREEVMGYNKADIEAVSGLVYCPERYFKCPMI